MYEYNAKVVHIVDGDTIDVDIDLGFDVILRNQRYRLYGIDAPESRTKDLEEKRFGLLAKHFLETRTPVGMNVVMRTYVDDKEKFGRYLGEIFVDGTNVNQEMITKHYAVEYTGQNKTDIVAAHLANRQILKESGVVI